MGDCGETGSTTVLVMGAQLVSSGFCLGEFPRDLLLDLLLKHSAIGQMWLYGLLVDRMEGNGFFPSRIVGGIGGLPLLTGVQRELALGGQEEFLGEH